MKKIRFGMVGGGPGAFIGQVHRQAAALDGELELVCGAFSRDAEKSKSMSESLGLQTQRCYSSYTQMFEHESSLPADERMQFVSIVTPNASHFEIAKAAFEQGFHVFCEKPATISLDESADLARLAKDRACFFALAHTYAGYSLVHEARARIAAGDIGPVTKVVVEYSQGWLAQSGVETDSKQAEWRLDPAQAGLSCCLADIGVHAAHLAEFVSGKKIEKVLADLSSGHEERLLDVDGSVLLRFEQGIRGVLLASQVSVGEKNNLVLRVYGTKGSVLWAQEKPNELQVRDIDRGDRFIHSGSELLFAKLKSRAPSGHPEGYLEAFANLYRDFARCLRHEEKQFEPIASWSAALSGMAFIEAAVSSHKYGNVWSALNVQRDVE